MSSSVKYIAFIIFIVKPWSKSLSQQAPKSNKSPPKKENKKDLDLGLTWNHMGHHPITFKHEGMLWYKSANSKGSQNDPLESPQKIDQMDSRKTTFFITSIFFLVNTPRRLEMISLACRYAQNCQIELLTLVGSIFMNSVKLQLWQHKVTPFKSKFLVLFGNLCFQKWSRNVCLAL